MDQPAPPGPEGAPAAPQAPPRNWFPIIMVIMLAGGAAAVVLSLFLGSGFFASKDAAPLISGEEADTRPSGPMTGAIQSATLNPNLSPEQMIQHSDNQALFGTVNGPAGPADAANRLGSNPALNDKVASQAQAMGAAAPTSNAAAVGAPAAPGAPNPMGAMPDMSKLMGGMPGGAPGAAPRALGTQAQAGPGQKKLQSIGTSIFGGSGGGFHGTNISPTSAAAGQFRGMQLRQGGSPGGAPGGVPPGVGGMPAGVDPTQMMKAMSSGNGPAGVPKADMNSIMQQAKTGQAPNLDVNQMVQQGMKQSGQQLPPGVDINQIMQQAQQQSGQH